MLSFGKENNFVKLSQSLLEMCHLYHVDNLDTILCLSAGISIKHANTNFNLHNLFRLVITCYPKYCISNSRPQNLDPLGKKYSTCNGVINILNVTVYVLPNQTNKEVEI